MRILVVEDEPKVASFLVRLLCEEGYFADACFHGDDAIPRAIEGDYDAVVLDWMLPGRDGVSICRELRDKGHKTPVLMLTARGEVEDRVRGLRSGADDYLAKPFEIEELLARVDALLRRSTMSGQLRAGPLVLDRINRRALAEGRDLGLTEREMAVLSHLVLRAGRCVTRSEILSRVWGLQFDPESNLIAVHISRLREKLGPLAPMVETVRGRGYRLNVDEDQ